jgi:hypothetical protein
MTNEVSGGPENPLDEALGRTRRKLSTVNVTNSEGGVEAFRKRGLAILAQAHDSPKAGRWAPEYLVPLAEAFEQIIKREPAKSERGHWIEGLHDLEQTGITPDELHDAATAMHERGLTIKSPGSLMALAWELHSKRKETGNPYTSGPYADRIDH